MSNKVVDLRKGMWAVYGDCPKCEIMGNRKHDNPHCIGCGTELDYSGTPRDMFKQRCVSREGEA